MILLAVTLCLATGGEADCQRTVRHVEDFAECRKVGKAMADYLTESEAPGVKVIFVGMTCKKGLDG